MPAKIAAILFCILINLALITNQAQAQPLYEAEAAVLGNLGLFLGTEHGYELERAASRAEAAVVLVRLIGKEQFIAEYNYQTPFNDLPVWAEDHIAYLYHQGIVNGMKSDLYGAIYPLTVQQYCALMLRSLNYTETAGDFSYNQTLAKATQIGLINAEQAADLINNQNIDRDLMVAIAYNALSCTFKNENITLLEMLYLENAITGAQLQAIGYDANLAPLIAQILQEEQIAPLLDEEIRQEREQGLDDANDSPDMAEQISIPYLLDGVLEGIFTINDINYMDNLDYYSFIAPQDSQLLVIASLAADTKADLLQNLRISVATEENGQLQIISRVYEAIDNLDQKTVILAQAEIEADRQYYICIHYYDDAISQPTAYQMQVSLDN